MAESTQTSGRSTEMEMTPSLVRAMPKEEAELPLLPLPDARYWPRGQTGCVHWYSDVAPVCVVMNLYGH